jgi:hypothetical protein
MTKGAPTRFQGGGELMRQAARMQRKLDQVREGLKDREVTASGQGERIKVTVTCAGRVRAITVDPELVAKEGLELALDAVAATVNGALDLADTTAQSEFDKVTGGLKLPGMG